MQVATISRSMTIPRVFKYFLLGIVGIVLGCGGSWRIRSGRYADIQESFETVIRVPLTVHIVGNRAQFPKDFLNAHPRAVGYQLGRHIYVIGHYDKHNVLHVEHQLLGHELMHVLNQYDSRIANPDIDYQFVEY